ncbi:hypothetical protein A8F94_07980 [Bacillus sp. FJAT-27225]|uniref:hypothetical protein n=1 Tax=Bacillus sp. FJAT-27225 TaxID=1743144 RepID=UPI00080C2359|nr:hypothetical protein [Bacillus sp. FJAT-27225]OCA87776.1 hypothetical protein A8F94_07980 [Bacillus sp. FJAT-27225]
MVVHIVKLIQYCLLPIISIGLTGSYGTFFEGLKEGETLAGHIVVLVGVVIFAFSYFFLMKWIAKYEITWFGVYFVSGLHMMVLFFLMVLPLDVYFGDTIRESFGHRIYQGLCFSLIPICVFIHWKWDILLLIRKRYYRPSAYSKRDWYKA